MLLSWLNFIGYTATVSKCIRYTNLTLDQQHSKQKRWKVMLSSFHLKRHALQRIGESEKKG